MDDNSDELYVKTLKHKNLRDPSGKNFNWTYNGVLNDHLLAGTYAIEQSWYFCRLDHRGHHVGHASRCREDHCAR